MDLDLQFLDEVRVVNLYQKATQSQQTNRVLDLNYKNQIITFVSPHLANYSKYQLNIIRLNFFNSICGSNINNLFGFLKQVESCSSLIIDISSNDISSQKMEELASSITQIQNINELQIGLGMNLQDNFSGLYKIFDSLAYFPQLKSLSFLLYYINMKNGQIYYLSQKLKQLPNLTQLDLRFNFNFLTDQSLIDLSESLKQLSELQKLYLSYYDNEISDAGFCAIFQNLFEKSQKLSEVVLLLKVNQKKQIENDLIIQNKNQALKKLNFKFQNSKLNYFFVLKYLPQIEDLLIELDRSEISEKAFEQISLILNESSNSSCMSQLQMILPLENQKIDLFQKSLSLCSKLQFLSLKFTHNSLIKEFYQSFSIQQFSALDLNKLELIFDCVFANQLINSLSEAISTQKNLKNLNLQLINRLHCEVIDLDIKGLFDNLQNLTQLQVLYLQINYFNLQQSHSQIIAKSLPQIVNLENLQLDISKNQLNGNGVKEIIDSLSTLHQHLKQFKIKLSDNPIQIENFGEITKGFSKLLSLKELILITNLEELHDQRDILFHIVNNLKKNYKLQYLQINLFGFEYQKSKALQAIKKFKSLVEYVVQI